MSDDARFEDADARPLRLLAREGDDLQVISALCQDAVLTAGDMAFRRGERRFALLLNRFRWEENRQPPERARAMLVIDGAMGVRSQWIDRTDSETVLSLLSLTFEPGGDGMGTLVLTFAGDGAVAIAVEMLEVTLRDVTRPYSAPSGQTPRHEA